MKNALNKLINFIYYSYFNDDLRRVGWPIYFGNKSCRSLLKENLPINGLIWYNKVILDNIDHPINWSINHVINARVSSNLNKLCYKEYQGYLSYLILSSMRTNKIIQEQFKFCNSIFNIIKELIGLQLADFKSFLIKWPNDSSPLYLSLQLN